MINALQAVKKNDYFLNVSHSFTNRAWRLRATPAQTRTAEMLSQQGDVSPLLAQVLAARDITPDTFENALNPSIKQLLPDPSTLTDMDRLTARLMHAVIARERIALFGDYDVDGACAVALLLRYLRAMGHDALFHIPDRLSEGYGPNTAALDRFKAQGVTLLVTLDCGTTSFDVFAHARTIGLDVLVIDHHQADAGLPETQGLVNPNRQDDVSHCGTLCAAGVTFMVLVALGRALRGHGYFAARAEPDLLAYLDLVALATVADVVPLTGLNRAFVQKGLAVLRQRRSPGLRALQDVARVSGPPEAFHLGYLLGPRINAGGRIGDAALGTRLLISNDEAESMAIAAQLERLNQERQVIEQVALHEAQEQAECTLAAQPETAVLVVHAAHWHAGVLGLIAARLKERYQRPSFALAVENGKATGSGRSLAGVDLGRAVRAAVQEGLLQKGGGHAMAAGITLHAANIGVFAHFINDACAAATQQARQDRALSIDALVLPPMLNEALVTEIGRAGPFGAGNAEPVFALPDMTLLYLDDVGTGHLRLTVQAQDGSKHKVMAFRARGTPLGDALAAARGQRLHFAVTLSLDHWRGRTRVGLRLVDGAGG